MNTSHENALQAFRTANIQVAQFVIEGSIDPASLSTNETFNRLSDSADSAGTELDRQRAASNGLADVDTQETPVVK